MDPVEANTMRSALRTAQATVRLGVCPGSDRAAANHWTRWRTFCARLAVDPLLSSLKDPFELLQIFTVLYRTGEIAPSGKPVRGRTVEGAIRAIGQTLASVGVRSPPNSIR